MLNHYPGLYFGYPHPCDFLGDPKRECTCTSLQIRRYQAKISGPLMDRIDLHMEAPAVPYKDLASLHEGGHGRKGAVCPRHPGRALWGDENPHQRPDEEPTPQGALPDRRGIRLAPRKGHEPFRPERPGPHPNPQDRPDHRRPGGMRPD